MEENLAPVITKLINNRYTVSVEEKINDEIFNSHDLPTFHTPTLEQDSAYKKPDKEQYIFSTMGGSLYTLYSNNMILPIRPKDKLKYSYNMNKRLLADFNKKEARGVYIIDYYRIASMVAFDPNFLNNIINYYYTTKNLYPDQIEIQEHIKDLLILNKTRDAFKQPHTVLRIVTFIPEEQFMKHSHVYVPTSDIVIGFGYISNKMIHPNSPLYKERNKITTSNVKNFIEIDIVDTATGYDRYLRVGNKVVTLKASRDPDRKDKAMMIVYKDNFPVEHMECELGKLEEDLGIFRTEEEALSNGDLKHHHELKKLENDFEKLENEKKRIEFDKTRLEADMEKLKIERDMLLEKQEFEKERIKLEYMLMDLKLHYTKLNSIIELQKKKFEFDTLAETYNIKKEYDRHRHELETDKVIREIEAYGIKNNLDLEIQQIKANSAKHNSIINIGKDILTATTTIGKIIA